MLSTTIGTAVVVGMVTSGVLVLAVILREYEPLRTCSVPYVPFQPVFSKPPASPPTRLGYPLVSIITVYVAGSNMAVYVPLVLEDTVKV